MAETASRWRDPSAWGLALWGALVAVAAFPPGPVWALALVAPAPVWALAVGRPWAHALRLGWAYGLGFFGFLLWWIVPTVVEYGGLPWPAGAACLVLLAAYLALYPAGCAAAVAVAARRSPGLALALAPFLWTGLEGVRGALLSGFPWGDLPQALWRQPTALALAPWVGVDGVRLLGAGLSAGAAWGLLRWRRGVDAGVGPLAVGGAAALVAAGLWALPRPVPLPEGQLRVAVVQGNIDQAQKWDPAYRRATLETYGALSRSASESRPDLFLWPETAVPLYAQDPGPERRGLEALARELGAPLAFGAPAYERRQSSVEYRNAVFLMGATGQLVGRYDKVHLVPFGEYVPLGSLLPFVKKLVAGAGDFTPGPGMMLLGGEPGLPALGALVCFEVIFPSFADELAAAGAQVLLVVTNDGWFGRTPGPRQHLAFAAWRAAEVGLPLVRAANTGVSAVFDGGGRLLRASGLGTREVLSLAVSYPPPHRTPQHRVRPWVWPLSLALALLGVSGTIRGFRRPYGNRPRR